MFSLLAYDVISLLSPLRAHADAAIASSMPLRCRRHDAASFRDAAALLAMMLASPMLLLIFRFCRHFFTILLRCCHY